MGKRKGSDPQFEIAFFENVLNHSPNFVEALACLGDLYTKEGLYEKGLRVDERLAALRPEDATVFYNLACSYSLMGEVQQADCAMRRAIELGYEDFEYLRKDPDLLNLLGSEEFQLYFKALRQRDRQKPRAQEAL